MAFKAFLFGYNTTGLSYVNEDLATMEGILQKWGYQIYRGTTIDKIDEERNNFCDGLNNSDTAIIYFSGHSIIKDNKFHLVCDDSFSTRFNYATRLVDTVISSFESSKAVNKLLILDCCRASHSVTTYSPDWTKGIKILGSSNNFSSSVEVDAFKSSSLMYFLNKALSTDFQKLLNREGVIKISNLLSYVNDEIRKYNQENSENFPTATLLGDSALDFSIIANVSFADIYLFSLQECLNICGKQYCYKQLGWCNIIKSSPIKNNEYVVPKVKLARNNKTTEKASLKKLIELLSSNTNTHLLLLGDSGIGKSIACLYLINELCAQSAEPPYLPMFFSLDSLIKKELFGKDILTIINESYNLEWDTERLGEITKKHSIVFFLDGFDELSDRSDHSRISNNLKKIDPFYITNAVVVLTCRTHYFVNDEQINEVILGQYGRGTDLLIQLNEKKEYIICQLQEFEKKQIIEYVNLKCGDTANEIIKQIESIYNLLDLSKRPILLKLIVETLPQLLKKNKQVSRITLYETYTRYWISREAERKELDISIEQKITFISHLAISMWERQTLSLPYIELQELLRSKYGREIFTEAQFYSVDYDTRNSSFLNRDELGFYKFMHKSFMEYFIGLKCVKEIRKDGQQMPSWKLRWFDKEVALFICELLMDDKNNEKMKALLSSSLISKDSYIIWNSLHIVSLLSFDAFEEVSGTQYLQQFERKAENEENSVILRQYCRVLAKFGKEEKAKKLIQRLIAIVKNNAFENQFNNETYINYYYGVNSACEAFLNHLSSPTAKYDRLLHLYVLGELGDKQYAPRLEKTIKNWTDKSYIKEARDTISTLKMK